MPRVRVGDVELYYVEHGAGEPLVLIMGFGGDHIAWGFQIPAFVSAGYRVVAFDNRGVGQSDTPEVPYTTRVMAEDTVGLMDALGIGRAHVLGVSMGGMIAQELALGFADRVRSLQLHCTYARPDRYMQALSRAWRSIRTSLSHEESLRAIALWLFTPATVNERPEFVELLIQNALANPYPQSLTGFLRQGDAVAAHDAWERLPLVRCPTLVTVADDDILVPPRFSRELAARIPGAELHTLPGAGHAYFWERPEAFNHLCLEFLARHRTT
jgi:pimeloyl-ACP methyl ester carboxylesterase